MYAKGEYSRIRVYVVCVYLKSPKKESTVRTLRMSPPIKYYYHWSHFKSGEESCAAPSTAWIIWDCVLRCRQIYSINWPWSTWIEERTNHPKVAIYLAIALGGEKFRASFHFLLPPSTGAWSFIAKYTLNNGTHGPCTHSARDGRTEDGIGHPGPWPPAFQKKKYICSPQSPNLFRSVLSRRTIVAACY